MNQALEISRTYTVSGDDNLLVWLRIGITMGLFVCVAGLGLRKVSGIVASMLGLVWLFLVYGWWRRESLAFLRNLEVADFSRLSDLSHAAGLREAIWWDVLVLVAAAILYVWQVVTLIRILKSSSREGAPQIR